MHTAPWMQAVEAQVDAYDIVNWLIQSNAMPEVTSTWKQDRALLKVAQPYDWGDETTEAVLRASAAVPDDASLNFWNLAVGACWWYFTKPLPFITTNSGYGVRAILFGWIGKASRKKIFPAGTNFVEIEQTLYDEFVSDRHFYITVYLDGTNHERARIAPSQIWTWNEGETLGEMMSRCRVEHERSYGKGGPLQHKPQIGLEQFMHATEAISRFILAGLTWINQRVVIETEGHIERHARKRIEKKLPAPADGPRHVKVIQLRRAEPQPKEREETDEERATREWSCRWMVGLDTGGFFRNQRVGPGLKDHRLVFIAPFMKGPKEKPLRLPDRKVFIVNR